MMTKDTILRCIKELECNLAKLRKAVEKLPAVPEPAFADMLSNLEQEEIEDESNNLAQLSAMLREQWNIPPDIKPEMPWRKFRRLWRRTCLKIGSVVKSYTCARRIDFNLLAFD